MKMKTIWIGFMLLLGLFLIKCDSSSSTNAVASAGDSAAKLAIKYTNHNFPDYCSVYPVPEGTKETFKLSQNYPDTFNVDTMPWLGHDFKTDYSAYLKTVLAYCMEGNLAIDFKVQDNPIRKWYNAPWMHDNGDADTCQNNGRECLHGLTREIKIDAFELHPKQTTDFQTYAIAFYNPPGGYTLGKVWSDPKHPLAEESIFPEGTVVFKLLFTEATLDEVPYLEGSKEWIGNIFYPANNKKNRSNHTLRIVQLDLMIKDNRASTGWVLGTFVYNAASAGKEWQDRMEPVGLMWGDDARNTSKLNDSYHYNPSLEQSVINPDILYAGEQTPENLKQAFVRHLGMGGRMNGPVDNPVSSCNSCHARAAVSFDGNAASIANFSKAAKHYGDTSTYNKTDLDQYFTDVGCGIDPIEEKGGKSYIRTDFSFQITNGIRNYHAVEGKDKSVKSSASRDPE